MSEFQRLKAQGGLEPMRLDCEAAARVGSEQADLVDRVVAACCHLNPTARPDMAMLADYYHQQYNASRQIAS